MLKRPWESADGLVMVMQLIVFRSKVEPLLKEMDDEARWKSSWCYKTIDKILKPFYWLYLCHGVGKCCQTCDIYAQRKGLQTVSRKKMTQCNVGLAFKRIAIDIA